MQTTSPTPAGQPSDLSRIAQDLQVRKVQVENVVALLDEGNTVPFITRYRKERTGGLDEEKIRRIQERITQLRQLAERKQTILKSIDAQGKLTDALREQIQSADSSKRLEDLYLPYKPKKRSLATDARDKGLEPLAMAIWERDPAVANLGEVVQGLINPEKGLNTPDDVATGVGHILAEVIAENADVRANVRHVVWDTGKLVSSKAENVGPDKGLDYKDYFAFTESARMIPPHRVLAVNRGERENILKIKIEWDAGRAREGALAALPHLADHPHRDLLMPVLDDALTRLLSPSLEREVRREQTEAAQEHAIDIFARNLRSLLLQPPLRGKRVLAIDPGLRTGCKLAALDETGGLIEESVIYPHAPQKRVAAAKHKLEELVRKHRLTIFAIGNGTACRESEQLVSEVIAELEQGSGRRKQPEVSTLPPAASAAESLAPAIGVIEPPAPVALAPEESLPAVMPAAFVETSTPPEAAAPPDAAPILPPAPGSEGMSPPVADLPAPVQLAAPTPPPPKHEPPLPSLDDLPPAPTELAYVIVNEAGASDYSASPIAREEFPNHDATTRGTISIGRRLQDPLSELVKIDPQHVGVGLYQHDVKPKHLKESIDEVIESCVNEVGVDVNHAGPSLLRYVSGLNPAAAQEVAQYRKANGPLRSRAQLLQVPNLGECRFTQAAAFLKVREGDDPLDATWVHPETYSLARQLLSELGYDADALRDKVKVEELRAKLNANAGNLPEIAQRLGVGEPTLDDIFRSLARPGRDPREDLPPPIFKTGVLKLEDITPGMELKGTVLNVVPFGAFVDIGLKESGLVHISQMANRYIKSPYDVVSVGDVVTVWVMEVKPGEKKISLSMIPPGQERRPPDRGGRFAGGLPRGERGERGPGGPPQPQPEQRERPPLPPRGERPGFQPRGERPGFQPRGGQGPGGRFGGRGPGGPGGP